MTDRHKDYARVCHAMAKAMSAAQTWQQVVETADALMHLHLRWRLYDEECARHEQEGGSMSRDRNPYRAALAEAEGALGRTDEEKTPDD